MGEAVHDGPARAHTQHNRHEAWLQIAEHAEAERSPRLSRAHVVLDLDLCALRWYEQENGEVDQAPRGSRALARARVSPVGGDARNRWRVLVLPPDKGEGVKALTLEAGSEGERDVWVQWLQCAAHEDQIEDGEHAGKGVRLPLTESEEVARLRAELEEQKALTEQVVSTLREELIETHKSMSALRRQANSLREEVYQSRKQLAQLQPAEGRTVGVRQNSRPAGRQTDGAAPAHVWPATSCVSDEPMLKRLSWSRLTLLLRPKRISRKAKPRAPSLELNHTY